MQVFINFPLIFSKFNLFKILQIILKIYSFFKFTINFKINSVIL